MHHIPVQEERVQANRPFTHMHQALRNADHEQTIRLLVGLQHGPIRNTGTAIHSRRTVGAIILSAPSRWRAAGEFYPRLQGYGTTLILISSSAFQAYLKATNGTQDQSTGQIIVTPDQFKQMKNFCLIFNTTTGETSRKCLTPDQQVWPTSQYAAIGGKCGNIYLVIADIGSVPVLSGSGIDFIAGQTFQQAYYTEYGRSPNQIGFATRPSNPAGANYDPNFTCPTSSGGGISL
uniref:Acid protease n=1 Tax=Mycena chlorophos TaxID=658473 RepID=A0ABQ0M8G0_MYCCL|nr:acid protease [Mycena chlorophos]